MKNWNLIGMFINNPGRMIGKVLCVIFEKKMKRQRSLDFLFLRYQNSILEIRFDMVVKAMIRKKNARNNGELIINSSLSCGLLM